MSSIPFIRGFVPEKIVETRQSTVVVGKEFVYKFLRINTPFLNQTSYFRIAWQRACEEILNHRILAPSLYQGLRLLRWINGKPEWISEKISFNLNPLNPPKEADDLAIIMKRVEDQDIVANHVLNNKSFSYKNVTNL